MPKGQFYALAIFDMGRLDTTGVGLKTWGSQRACSHDYPMALDPLLHGEQKPAHDFLFRFVLNTKTIMPHGHYDPSENIHCALNTCGINNSRYCRFAGAGLVPALK